MPAQLPYNYDYINAEVSRYNPNKVHVSNTALAAYFRRYLLQKAFSVYKWKMPKTWVQNYFLYSLYCIGYVAVIYTDKFGTIPQHCGLYGRGVMYQPTHAVISNPLLKGDLRPVIGKTCEIVKLQPDYGGIMDLVHFYGDMMAICATGAAMNTENSKLAYAFAVNGKTGADSFKKMYDKLESGDPAVFFDKSLLDAEGKPAWQTFQQNLSQNYIAGDMLLDLQKWEDQFCTAVGIPNSDTKTKERTTSFDVAGHNIETAGRADMWLDELKACCERVNDMFGSVMDTPLSVDWRYQPDTKEGVDDERDVVDSRPV